MNEQLTSDKRILIDSYLYKRVKIWVYCYFYLGLLLLLTSMQTGIKTVF